MTQRTSHLPAETPKVERILCAAIWYNDGVEYHRGPFVGTGFVLCGYRHDAIREVLDKIYSGRNKERDTEGFLTSDNRFVSRKTAMNIAVFAGQYKNDTGKVELYSDDLY